MGMILGLSTLRDENIDRCLADPPLIMCVMAPEDPEAYYEATGIDITFGDSGTSATKPGFLGRLFGRKPAPETRPLVPEQEQASAVKPPPPPQLEFHDGENEEIDLDKAWHAIHYILTESAWEGDPPWSFLLTGGEQVGDIDVGFGPAHALKSDEVKQVDRALQGLSVQEFRDRFDGQKLQKADIYPGIWDRDPDDDDIIGYVVENYETVQDFVHRAAQNGFGIVISTT